MEQTKKGVRVDKKGEKEKKMDEEKSKEEEKIRPFLAKRTESE